MSLAEDIIFVNAELAEGYACDFCDSPTSIKFLIHTSNHIHEINGCIVCAKHWFKKIEQLLGYAEKIEAILNSR